MKQTPRRIATTVVAGLAVLGLGAAPALADSQRHRDPRGDVGTIQPLKAAPKPGIDLVRAANSYEGRTLKLSVAAANLQPRDYGVLFLIQAENGGFYQLTFDHTGRKPVVGFDGGATRRAWSGARALHRGVQPPPTCKGVKATDRGDAVVASVPRRCLDGADAVRVASLIIEPRSTSSSKVDDAWRKGFDTARGPKFAPELQRG